LEQSFRFSVPAGRAGSLHRPRGRCRRGITLLVVCLSCSRLDRPAGPPPTPAEISLEQFQALRWLQGTWRGSEQGANPFFESYVFLSDSTIRSFTYPDSTFAEASDSGAITWARNQVTSTMGGSTGGSTWVVTHFDSLALRFDPVRNATNSFTWIPESRAAWTARVEARGATGAVRERVYRMERVGT